MAVTEHLDRFQRKHPWAGFPLAVAYKYFDDFGTYLAALLTYYGFVSLFPLLLLLSTVLGFVLSGDQGLQHEGGEKPAPKYNYGVEYSNTDIDAALRLPDPLERVRHNPFNAESAISGHGTHVASIAAGLTERIASFPELATCRN